MKINKIYRILYTTFRYDLPIWLMGLLTNWMPDNRITIKIRGAMFKPFIKSCGRDFRLAKDVQLKCTDSLTIGNNVYFASGVWLNAMGGLTIDDEVVLGPYVVISTGIHQFKDNSTRFGGTTFHPVKIGKGSWLAAHVVVKAGVNIGSGVVVAGNAAVVNDTPDNVVVGGVPAKVICPRVDTTEPIIKSRFDVNE